MQSSSLKNIQLYANPHKQPLAQHLFAVGEVANGIFLNLCKEKKNENNDFRDTYSQIIRISGVLHDIGKTDSQFQSWITKNNNISTAANGQHIDNTKFSFNNHARHNEISLFLIALAKHFGDKKAINHSKSIAYMHAALWHHAKPIRKTPLLTIKSIFEIANIKTSDDLQSLLENCIFTLKQVDKLQIASPSNSDSNTHNLMKPIISGLESILGSTEVFEWCHGNDLKQLLEPYKTYGSSDKIPETIKGFVDEIDLNATLDICRSCVISADRLVSSLSSKELNQKIESNSLHELLNGFTSTIASDSLLTKSIHSCLSKPEYLVGDNKARSEAQTNAAKELINSHSISVLAGAAGCGKTKVALEWTAGKGASQIIWICPRIQVCMGIYEDLRNDYTPNIKVEICTGEIHEVSENLITTENVNTFSGDIIVTTIDQVVSRFMTHKNIDGMHAILNSTLIFDEFHEYISMPAMNLLFVEIIKAKSKLNRSDDVLLVSATPNYFYINTVLNINSVTPLSSFNKQLYSIQNEVVDNANNSTNPLISPIKNPEPHVHFVVSNTATTAQIGFLKNAPCENSIVFHSKYTRGDQKSIFNKVYTAFKRNGIKNYDILRSGPIVQASLNITCDGMTSEMTSAENTLQRLGRLNRFGENCQTSSILKIINVKGKTEHWLQQSNILKSSQAWRDYLISHISKATTLEDIYNHYRDFYKTDLCKKASEFDLLRTFKDGFEVFKNGSFDPIEWKLKEQHTGQVKLGDNSLRGKSRFVNMTLCKVFSKIGELSYQILNSYTYSNDRPDTLMSCDVRVIEESGLNRNMQKFSEGMGWTNKREKGGALWKAKNSESPFYTSFTEADAATVQCLDTTSAIHYVEYINQQNEKILVGSMHLKDISTSINQIKN